MHQRSTKRLQGRKTKAEVTRLPGFSLTTEVCVVDCGPHGSCIGGVCQCEEGWTGPECEQRDCHPRCIDHGICREGKCDCHQGWTGEHCTIGEYAHRRLNVEACRWRAFDIYMFGSRKSGRPALWWDLRLSVTVFFFCGIFGFNSF